MNNSTYGALSVSALLLALNTSPVMADDTSATTPDLLITSGAEARPTKEIASSYTIISAKDIETYQYHSVVDALQSVPGLHVVQSGGAGQIASVFTRGANSNQTLVMLNGLPINDPSSPGGAANLANIPMENIERIEVVRGAQSALYGSQAIGGVINIITKSGGDTPVSTAKVEVGTLGTINTSASTGGKVMGTDYFLSASRNATDGNDVTPAYLRGAQHKEKDGNETYGLSGKIGFPIGDIAKSNLSIQYTSANTDIDDLGDDAFFTPVYENYNNQIKTTRLLIGGDVSGSYFDNRWRPKLSAGLVRTLSNSYDYAAGGDDSVYSYELGYSGDTKTLAFDNAFDIADWNTLTFGASYQKDNYHSTGYRDFTGGFVITQNSDAETSASAVYLGDEITLADRFFLTLSGRFDMPEDFDNRFSWTIAPAYEIQATNTRLTASYGTGFKAPSLYQLFGYSVDTGFPPSTFNGNPNLKPETSRNWDVGIEQSFLDDKLNLGATWFHSDIKDAIVVYYLSPTFNSSTKNSENFSSEGLETFISYNISDNISTRIDYTYTLINTDVYTTTMTRRPRHKIGLTASWTPIDGTVLSTNTQWVDPYRDVPRDGFGYYVYPAPYTVVNIALSQKLTDALTLTAGINNLLDQKYEPAHGFEAAGIEALAGLSVTF